MENNNRTVSLSLGSLPTLLTILFVALKLTNVITWSWWWVLAPVWIPICLDVLAIIIIIIILVMILK